MGRSLSRNLAVALVALLAVAALGACSDAPPRPPERRPASLAELLGPWQPVPLVLGNDVIERVDRLCRANGLFPHTFTLAVVDARGGSFLTAVYDGDRGQQGSCVELAIQPDGLIRIGGSELVGPRDDGVEPQLPPQSLQLWMSRDGDPRGFVLGEAGAGIARVVIRAPGQQALEASLANGWFVAWWPSPGRQEFRILGYDAAGNQVAVSN